MFRDLCGHSPHSLDIKLNKPPTHTLTHAHSHHTWHTGRRTTVRCLHTHIYLCVYMWAYILWPTHKHLVLPSLLHLHILRYNSLKLVLLPLILPSLKPYSFYTFKAFLLALSELWMSYILWHGITQHAHMSLHWQIDGLFAFFFLHCAPSVMFVYLPSSHSLSFSLCSYDFFSAFFVSLLFSYRLATYFLAFIHYPLIAAVIHPHRDAHLPTYSYIHMQQTFLYARRMHSITLTFVFRRLNVL